MRIAALVGLIRALFKAVFKTFVEQLFCFLPVVVFVFSRALKDLIWALKPYKALKSLIRALTALKGP